MNKRNELREFLSLVRDILHSKEFREMRTYKHHENSTLYDHSVKVAYLCYKHHKHFNTKIDIKEFVRGALLHDYYLYDLHSEGTNHRFHWFRHSDRALKNARERYPLTTAQEDMIRCHMFPITLRPPRTKAGWIVCFYDKVAAIGDRFGKHKRKTSGLPICSGKKVAYKKQVVY